MSRTPTKKGKKIKVVHCPRVSLGTLDVYVNYSVARCKANPVAAEHAVTFVALRDKCVQAQADEFAYRGAVVEGQDRSKRPRYLFSRHPFQPGFRTAWNEKKNRKGATGPK